MNPRLRPLPVLFALMCLSGCGGGDYPVDAAAASQAPAAEFTSSVLAVDPAGVAASAAADAASAATPSAVASRLEPAQGATPGGDAPVATPQTEDAGQGAGRTGDRAARDADASAREAG